MTQQEEVPVGVLGDGYVTFTYRDECLGEDLVGYLRKLPAEATEEGISGPSTSPLLGRHRRRGGAARRGRMGGQ